MKNALAMTVLLLLLGMWAVLIFASVTNDAPFASPSVHGVHDQMLTGEAVAARDAPIWRIGALFSTLISVFMCSLLLFAVDPRHTARVAVWLIPPLVPWIAGFIAMCLNFNRYIGENDQTFLGPFPMTTTMIFVVWFSPVYCVLLYLFAFRQWFATDEQLAGYQALLDARDAETAKEGEA